MPGTLSKDQVREAIRRGAILAIPKKGESNESAVARVQLKHPGKEVVDPTPEVVAELKDALETEREEVSSNKTIKQYRESVGGFQNYYNLVRSGVKILPHPIADNNLDTIPDANELETTRLSGVPDKWKVPRAVSRSRFVQDTMDHRFSLFQIRKNRLENETQLGRTWNTTFQGKFSFRRGYNWGGKCITLEPAYASLTTERVDKGAVAAMQALGYTFPGARSSELVVEARGPIRELVNIEYNPVRLLSRLAAMWLAAKMVESKGAELRAVGADGHPKFEYLHGAGDISRLTIDAVYGSQQVLYLESGRFGTDVRYLEVLMTAMTSKVQFGSTNPNVRIPTIVKFWPEIPNPVVAIYGPKETRLNYGVYNAGTIWEAISYITSLMNVRELWWEVFQSVATMAWRPDGDSAFCGHKAVSVALPISAMQPAALGPMMMNSVQWYEREQHMEEPFLSDVAWDSTVRYMQWSLLHRDLCAQLGAHELLSHTPIDTSVKRMEWMVYSHTVNIPAALVVQGRAKKYGWDTLLGRILATTRGENRTSSAAETPLYIATSITNKNVLQWEEAIPYVECIPEGSSALSMLYPARPSIIPPNQVWIRPVNVINRYGTADAIYTMSEPRKTQLALEVRDIEMQRSHVIPYRMRLNYRDAPRDGQFFNIEAEGEYRLSYLMKIPLLRDCITLHGDAMRNAESEWFVSYDYDIATDEYLGYHEEIDKGFPKTVADMIASIDLAYKMQIDEHVDMELDDEEPEQLQEPEELPKAKGLDTELIMYESKYDNIKKTMGTVPKWIDTLMTLKTLTPDPAKRMSANTMMVEVSTAVLDLKPEELPALAIDASKVPSMMQNIAFFIREAASKPPVTISMGNRMAEIETAVYNIGANYASSEGVWDATSFELRTGKPIPEFIDRDEFATLIAKGARSQELGNMPSIEAYQKYQAAIIEEYERRLDEYIGSKGIELGREEAEVQVQKMIKQQGKTLLDIADEDEPEPSTPIKEVVILDTREERTLTEPIDEGTPSRNFGGAALLPASGGEDQPSASTARVSDATRTSPEIITMEFQAGMPPEKDSQGKQ
jgi:hypothetical protein